MLWNVLIFNLDFFLRWRHQFIFCFFGISVYSVMTRACLRETVTNEICQEALGNCHLFKRALPPDCHLGSCSSEEALGVNVGADVLLGDFNAHHHLWGFLRDSLWGKLINWACGYWHQSMHIEHWVSFISRLPMVVGLASTSASDRPLHLHPITSTFIHLLSTFWPM